MLAYLDVARIDGHALAGANGAIAVNQRRRPQRAGQPAGIAKGDRADVAINARQLQQGNRVLSGPLQATAFIGGDAPAGASGIASINQASGIANTTLNVVSATLADRAYAKPTIRPWPPRVPRWQGRDDTGYGVATGTRSAGSQHRTAGIRRVLQLNQIAGNGNDTANVLGLVVQDRP